MATLSFLCAESLVPYELLLSSQIPNTIILGWEGQIILVVVDRFGWVVAPNLGLRLLGWAPSMSAKSSVQGVVLVQL